MTNLDDAGSGTLITLTVERSCPQKIVLGPTLWKIVMKDFLSCGEDMTPLARRVLIIGWCCLLRQRGVEVLSRVRHWTERLKLQLALPKRQILMFKGRIASTKDGLWPQL